VADARRGATRTGWAGSDTETEAPGASAAASALGLSTCTVGHGQRFLLVVGDEQGGGAEPLLQRADLLVQLQPYLGIQGGQRLVEQQHPGLDGQRWPPSTGIRC